MKRDPENDWWSNEQSNIKPLVMSVRGYGLAMAQVIGATNPDAIVFNIQCPNCGTIVDIRKRDILDHRPAGNGMNVRLHEAARTCARCQAEFTVSAPVQLRISDG